MSATVEKPLPWWKEPTRGQWFTFVAAWLGWVLDAFDFTIYLLVSAEIAREFNVTPTSTMLVVTATLVLRLLGGVAAGWAGDRWGRKLPLMISLLWLAIFDGAIAFAPTYAWVVVLRTLFGFGMGAEWSAGATLAMENWPARSRGIASGILQGGWPVGYFLAATVATWVVPAWGWRALFLFAAVPALLVIPIRFFVPESRDYEQAKRSVQPRMRDLLDRKVLGRIAWASAVMATGFGVYYALVSQHVPLLKVELGVPHASAMQLVNVFNVGMLIGALVWGAVAMRKGAVFAILLPALLALPFLPLFVGAVPALPALAIGALAAGLFGAGYSGVTPLWLTAVFPPHVRAKCVGIVYQLGSLIAALVPPLVTFLAARASIPLGTSIASIAAGCVVLMAIGLWFRPRDVLRDGPRPTAAASPS